MAIIQSFIDNGTEIQLTIVSPVVNVDVHIDYYIQNQSEAIDSCVIKPISLTKFTIANTNRSAYKGIGVYAEVKIVESGMPSNVMADETSATLTIN